MPCPHSGTSASEAVSRRDFVRVAVSIGGASALSACLARDGGRGSGTAPDAATPTATESGDLPDLPTGDRDAVPDRQHSWGEYILSDEHGNPKFPEYQAFLLLDYAGDGVPTDDERETVESAFRSLEEAYVWGAGEQSERRFFHDGLLFTIAYSPSYFARFDESLPGDVDLRPPEEVLEAAGQDPAKADGYDAVVHLATDFPSVLLATELALLGDRPELNGVEMAGHLGDVFDRRERRGGFVGQGLPAENLDEERVPDEAAASMGFKSALRDNLPSEDRVTIRNGPFAGGTIEQVAKLTIDLGSWYDHDLEQRVEQMYSPHHEADEVGPTGEGVAANSGVSEEMADRTVEDARELGVVGHAQKVARARDEEFDPVMLRRGDFNSAHPDGSVLQFGALTRTSADLVDTLRAMYDVPFEGEEVALDDETDGILPFVDVQSRGTYLMPPRDRRALPTPRPR